MKAKKKKVGVGDWAKITEEWVESNRRNVEVLNFVVKTYDALTKVGVATQNRLKSMGDVTKETESEFDYLLEGAQFQNGKWKIRGINTLRNNLLTKMKHLLEAYPLYTEWLRKIPGIGEFLAAKLILLYYFRFVPICKDCGAELVKEPKGEDQEEGRNGGGNTFVCSGCGKKAKGEGNLSHKVMLKDFQMLSGWRHYMGRDNDPVTGRMRKRARGETMSFSPEGRRITYMIGDQLIKQTPSPYRAYYDKRREYRESTHPGPAKKNHRHQMSRNEVSKLLLAHMWMVARHIEGKPITKPWIFENEVGGVRHSHVIQPYFWEHGEITWTEE